MRENGGTPFLPRYCQERGSEGLSPKTFLRPFRSTIGTIGKERRGVQEGGTILTPSKPDTSMFTNEWVRAVLI